MKMWCLSLLLFSPLLLAGDSLRMESFEKVWRTVKEKHWDLEGTGADWDKLYKEYKPKVKDAGSASEFRAILMDMLNQLGQSHFAIYGPEVAEAEAELQDMFGGGLMVSGFQTSIISDRVFITKIDLDYDAAKQGLGIGTEILSVSDKNMRDVVPKIKAAFDNELYQQRMLEDIFSGSGKLDMKVRQDGKEKDVTIRLGAPKGKPQSVMGMNLNFHYASHLDDENLGYLTFNYFVPALTADFARDINVTFKEADGLVIDLRGNPGGVAMLAMGMAGRLMTEKKKTLGTMSNPGGTMKFPVFPQKGAFTGPVAVLIDGGSASTSEIFSQGLSELGRVRLFGTQSAGAALPSLIETLPTGDRFQYAVADYQSPNGRRLEGIGVAPDVVTPHTLESMSRGEDAALTAAKNWIKKQNAGAKREGM